MVGFFSAVFLTARFLAAAFFHQSLLLHNANSPLSYFPTTAFLPGAPFSSDLASSTAAASSTWSLYFLAWWRMVFRSLPGLCIWIQLQHDSQVCQWILQDSVMIFLHGDQRALCISGLFKILLRSVLSILCMQKLQLLLREAALYRVPYRSFNLVESIFSPSAEMTYVPTRSRFQNLQCAYIKQVIPGMFLTALTIPLSSL